MLVKSARRYINTLDKILKNQHNDIITEITEDDDMDIFSVTLKFHIDGLFCFVAAFNNDDNVLYYVKGNGRAVTYIISDNETQKESMYTILNRIYDIVVRLTTETEEIKESTEDSTEHKDVSDLQESTERDRSNYPMETHSFALSKQYSYRDVEKVCGDCSHFNACMQGYDTIAPTCCMFDSLRKARNNPEWHHVSLATLANLDFGMLDKKRQLYISLYREIKELIKDLHNCKSCHSYEKRLAKIYSRNADLVDENKVTSDYIRYVTRKVSMCNVECGVWTSANEESTGYHKSRRYNQVTLRH